MGEFEAFLALLQSEFSTKKKKQSFNGKQHADKSDFILTEGFE
jgi:hypothetical protein